MSYMKRFLELEDTPCPFCLYGMFKITDDLKLQCHICGVKVEVTKENLDKMMKKLNLKEVEVKKEDERDKK